MNWPMYFVNVLCLLSVILPVPFYCLSIYLARKRKPVVGGVLALVKLLATIRVSSVLWGYLWDAAAMGAGWRLFGAGHNTASTVLFSALLILGTVCLLVNFYVLVKQMGMRTRGARRFVN